MWITKLGGSCHQAFPGSTALRTPGHDKALPCPPCPHRGGGTSLYVSNKNDTKLYSTGAWVTPATCCLVLSCSTPKRTKSFRVRFSCNCPRPWGWRWAYISPDLWLSQLQPSLRCCCARDPGARPPAKTPRPDLQVLLVGVGHGKGRIWTGRQKQTRRKGSSKVAREKGDDGAK